MAFKKVDPDKIRRSKEQPITVTSHTEHFRRGTSTQGMNVVKMESQPVQRIGPAVPPSTPKATAARKPGRPAKGTR